MKRLNISVNRRYLRFDDGAPFFWLGDTAWELFHRTTLEEAEVYLENRRQKGFTVIQAVALAELDGLNTPNAYGERPLADNNPLQPNESYFQYVDRVIELAGQRGIFVALLPTWGDKIELLGHGIGPIIFNPANAFPYGQWIGRRYREVWNLIWINGGDRPGGGANQAIWNALGEGIKSVDPHHLMTFHPPGGGDGRSSSEWFQQAGWLDFHLAQSGHERKDLPNYQIVAHDYALTPVHPCLDGEPRYEDHPVNWKPLEQGWFDDYDARQAAYWAMFAGAFGHTYGCHPLWQFYQAGRDPVGFARRPWRQALDLPGASHMAHVKNLFLSRPFFTRVPDHSLVVPKPHRGEPTLMATRGENYRYAFVYLPVGGEVTLDLHHFPGRTVTAWWYDPRTGWALDPRIIPNRGLLALWAPSRGRGQDWVLVLDDADTGFPTPGTPTATAILCS